MKHTHIDVPLVDRQKSQKSYGVQFSRKPVVSDPSILIAEINKALPVGLGVSYMYDTKTFWIMSAANCRIIEVRDNMRSQLLTPVTATINTMLVPNDTLTGYTHIAKKLVYPAVHPSTTYVNKMKYRSEQVYVKFIDTDDVMHDVVIRVGYYIHPSHDVLFTKAYLLCDGESNTITLKGK